MTSLIVDKRIVESVLKAVPTKSMGVDRSNALGITDGGWLLAFSGDGRAGFAVRITVDKDNVNMGGETPEPLNEVQKKHSHAGAVSGMPQILEPFAVDDLGYRETVAEPEELMLPLLNLAPVLKIKCVQARTPIKPPKPLTALHMGWERQPGTGASLWVVAWHSDRLRAVSMPVRNGVPR